MADCSCEKAKAELEEFLRGELLEHDRSDIAGHLDNCAPCDEEKNIGLALTNKVKQACCETAPDELTARILSELSREAGD